MLASARAIQAAVDAHDADVAALGLGGDRPFHEDADSLRFTALGEIVVFDGNVESRAPIRAALVAVRSPDAWRLRQFHGSIPSGF